VEQSLGSRPPVTCWGAGGLCGILSLPSVPSGSSSLQGSFTHLRDCTKEKLSLNFVPHLQSSLCAVSRATFEPNLGEAQESQKVIQFLHASCMLVDG